MGKVESCESEFGSVKKWDRGWQTTRRKRWIRVSFFVRKSKSCWTVFSSSLPQFFGIPLFHFFSFFFFHCFHYFLPFISPFFCSLSTKLKQKARRFWIINIFNILKFFMKISNQWGVYYNNIFLIKMEESRLLSRNSSIIIRSLEYSFFFIGVGNLKILLRSDWNVKMKKKKNSVIFLKENN